MRLFGPPNVKRLKAKLNVKGLIKALDYRKDDFIRQEAAVALGQIGDSIAVEPLIAALNDCNKVTISESIALRDVDAGFFQTLLKPSKKSQCIAIIGALGQIGDNRAVEPLSLFIKSSKRTLQTDVIVLTLQPLIINGDSYYKDKVRTAIMNRVTEYYDFHDAVVYALGQIGGPSAVNPLVMVLNEGYYNICDGLLSVLDKCGTSRQFGNLERDKSVANMLLNINENVKRDILKVTTNALDRVGWHPVQDRTGAFYWIGKEEWKRCVEIGKPAVEPLIGTLKNKDGSVRCQVAEALGQIGDTRAIRPLLEVLQDNSDLNAQKAAANALVSLGWKPEKDKVGITFWIVKQEWDKCVELGETAVGQLINEFNNDDCRNAAGAAIVKIGVPAFKPLISALNDRRSKVRSMAEEVLAQIGIPAVKQLIVSLKVYEIRNIVESILVKIGAPAVELLIAALKDYQGGVFLDSAKVLHKLGWTPGLDENGAAYWISQGNSDKCLEIGTPAVEILIVALKEGNDYIRSKAAESLGRIGDLSATEPLILALNDSHEKVRCSSVDALGRIGDAHASNPLIAILTDNNIHSRVRSRAIIALGNIGEAQVVEQIMAELSNADWWMREAAANALGQIGNARVIKPLIDVLGDGKWSVRKAAAEALIKLYQFGFLDEVNKDLILTQQGKISSYHSDRVEQKNTSSDCSYEIHTDNNGIGVSFMV
jgi:HEAT repeat protein